MAAAAAACCGACRSGGECHVRHGFGSLLCSAHERSLPKMWRMNTNTMKEMAATITACCSSGGREDATAGSGRAVCRLGAWGDQALNNSAGSDGHQQKRVAAATGSAPCLLRRCTEWQLLESKSKGGQPTRHGASECRHTAARAHRAGTSSAPARA